MLGWSREEFHSPDGRSPRSTTRGGNRGEGLGLWHWGWAWGGCHWARKDVSGAGGAGGVEPWRWQAPISCQGVYAGVWTHLRSGGRHWAWRARNLPCGPARWQTWPDRSTTKRNEQGSSPLVVFERARKKKQNDQRYQSRSDPRFLPLGIRPQPHTETQHKTRKKRGTDSPADWEPIPIQGAH